eukprot:gnl/MRDRNA2_/MRDRNA2_187311_c0_seq1.p1 gnl/MRDRNA2_/MRDRNA2_187311_c0~~gnl/MRDRNA2_/MRDRNA2_187311_c0_seq1.p1  ORF type:complete len:682 (-),score=116.88 gnl/MRDRNA2_/MRDRNA2_187311_c0_seq1:92-2083(-)
MAPNDNKDSGKMVRFAVGGSPVISAYSPANGATGIAITANIVLTFNMVVVANSGNIVLTPPNDALTPITIAVTSSSTDGQVTISGSTLTINPSADLTESMAYTITMSAGTVKSLDWGDSFGGISGTEYQFTTADVGEATLSNSSPASGSTGVSCDANVVLTFSEIVQSGSGVIWLYSLASESLIDVTGNQVNFDSQVMTINPNSDFASGSMYTVTMAAGVVKDAQGNNFAGIHGTSYIFTTETATMTTTMTTTVTTTSYYYYYYYTTTVATPITKSDESTSGFSGELIGGLAGLLACFCVITIVVVRRRRAKPYSNAGEANAPEHASIDLTERPATQINDDVSLYPLSDPKGQQPPPTSPTTHAVPSLHISGDNDTRQCLNQPGSWDFFVSHTQRNALAKMLAEGLYGSLRESNLSVWLDVKMKQRSMAAMQEGIRNCRCVIAIITGAAIDLEKPSADPAENAYFARSMCVQELKWAREGNIHIQPVILAEDKKKIADLVSEAPEEFHDLMSVDFIALDRSDNEYWEVGIKKLIRVLESQPQAAHWMPPDGSTQKQQQPAVASSSEQQPVAESTPESVQVNITSGNEGMKRTSLADTKTLIEKKTVGESSEWLSDADNIIVCDTVVTESIKKKGSSGGKAKPKSGKAKPKTRSPGALVSDPMH